MPRIRTLKPEHTISKKVGRLSDRAYRLWISLITQADDEGRGEWDAEQFRCLAFAYTTLKATKIQQAAEEIVVARLAYLYRPPGFPLLYQLHDWEDHQRVDNPSESRFPPPSEDSIALASPREDSQKDLPGSDRRILSDRRIGSDPCAPGMTPEELVQIYNNKTPDNCPAVKTLSPGRRTKCRKYLAMFPRREWWEAVFEQYHQSRFLQGTGNKTQGHESFTPDLDWLLSRGKDGTENCVKVHDGRYRDGA